MSFSFATPVTRGLTYVTIAAIAWGTGGVVAAILYRTSGLGPIAVSFWRTVGGVVLLALVRVWRRQHFGLAGKKHLARQHFGLAGKKHLARHPGVRPDGVEESTVGSRWRRLAVAVVTGAGLATYQTAYYAAVRESGVAFATMVTLGSGPVLIAIGARLSIGERLGRLGLAAVLLAPVGLVLIAGGDGGTGRASLLGLVFSLVSGVGYAVVTVLHRALGGVDPAGRGASSRRGRSVADTTLTGFAVALVLLAPLAVAEGLLPVRGVPGQTLALLAYLGAVATALAYSLFFASLSVIRATTVSILTLVEPLTASAIAVALLGERLTWPLAAGSTVLLASVVLLARGESRSEVAMVLG